MVPQEYWSSYWSTVWAFVLAVGVIWFPYSVLGFEPAVLVGLTLVVARSLMDR